VFPLSGGLHFCDLVQIDRSLRPARNSPQAEATLVPSAQGGRFRERRCMNWRTLRLPLFLSRWATPGQTPHQSLPGEGPCHTRYQKTFRISSGGRSDSPTGRSRRFRIRRAVRAQSLATHPGLPSPCGRRSRAGRHGATRSGWWIRSKNRTAAVHHVWLRSGTMREMCRTRILVASLPARAARNVSVTSPRGARTVTFTRRPIDSPPWPTSTSTNVRHTAGFMSARTVGSTPADDSGGSPTPREPFIDWLACSRAIPIIHGRFAT
jgi:hypothetical protein